MKDVKDVKEVKNMNSPFSLLSPPSPFSYLSLFPDDLVERALRNIYNKHIDVKTEIEPNLFAGTFQALNLAVDKAFGNVKYNHPDIGFINELKFNNAVFAAFKVHREQNDIALKLVDDAGKLKSFSQFRDDAKTIDAKYQTWLKTEYNTAVIRARQAANFKKFERDADLFPNLKWLASTSVEKRKGHQAFYGLIKPINDKFWQEHYPGNLWNCKCGITNTDAEPTTVRGTNDYTPDKGLDNNPALTGEVFNLDTHPYGTEAYIPKKQLEAIANRTAKAAQHELLLKQYREQYGKDWHDDFTLAEEIDIPKEGNLTNKLISIAQQTKDAKNEMAFAFDKDGKLKFRFTGIEKEVQITENAENLIVAHNHPSKSFFSIDDFESAMNGNYKASVLMSEKIYYLEMKKINLNFEEYINVIENITDDMRVKSVNDISYKKNIVKELINHFDLNLTVFSYE